MADYILHIDTSGNRGIVMISSNGVPMVVRENNVARDHAAFVQPAIREILIETRLLSTDIDAIAVSNGPGSYTGLRVGLASAKGLCYAWQKPLILISSLHIMAKAMMQSILAAPGLDVGQMLFAPMVDARRMEVFYALYRGSNCSVVHLPAAAVIQENWLSDQLVKSTIYFSGSGAEKWKSLCISLNAVFLELPLIEEAFAQIASEKYSMKSFDDTVYSEPFYQKAFFHQKQGL